jgi:hypothetical protein
MYGCIFWFQQSSSKISCHPNQHLNTQKVSSIKMYSMQQIISLKNLWEFTVKGQKNTQYNLSNAKTVIQWGKINSVRHGLFSA